MGSGSSSLQVALSGCTACVARVSNGVLHVANLGDSRAVLGVQEPDGRWSALSLTNDHNAQNPDEVQRILGEHPRSERRSVIRHDRLLGLLLPFRCFIKLLCKVYMCSIIYYNITCILFFHFLLRPCPHFPIAFTRLQYLGMRHLKMQ